TATNQGHSTTTVSPAQAEATVIPPRPFANTNVPEELLVLTNDNARYTFTSHGGGVKLIELVRYPESVSTRREKQQQPQRVASLNVFTPSPTLALLDGDAVQGDGVFTLTKREGGVSAEKTLTNGLSIVKEFILGTNYLLSAKVRLKNTSTQTLNLAAQE